MRVGVRLEVRLLSVPVGITDSDVIRATLGDLLALLGTLENTIRRALALTDKADASTLL